VPRNGIGFGFLRYLKKDEKIRSQLDALPHAEVSFNYLGQIGQSVTKSGELGFVTESRNVRSSRGKRTHLIDINGGIMGGRLEMEWTYSENLHRASTVEKLVNDFLMTLRSIIDHCHSLDMGERAFSQLSEFGWDQEDLDELASVINHPK
jgi:non-ribosomal peptide synthase protein (TIGR01720 family)